MRITRRLLIAAVFLGMLFIAANVAAESIAENRIAAQAKESFGSSTEPDVELDGFPILVSVLRGRIARASIAGRDLQLDDLAVARATITVEDLRASLDDITKGNPIRVGRGLAVADVDGDSVNAYLKSRGHKVTVTILTDLVVAQGALPGGRTGRAEGVPRIVGRLLVFRPDRVSVGGRPLSGAALEAARRELSFEVDLPQLPGGIRITAVELEEGSARFIARFGPATLDL